MVKKPLTITATNGKKTPKKQTMVDITRKNSTLRTATAQAIVKVGQQATIEAIEQKTVPKGDVLEMAKTAGLFAVKKTSDLIPDCHPLPIEYTAISYKIEGLSIIISITVKAIYRTGVEVEAMHGASVIALTLYDMLKPIDKEIEINQIKLLHKKGGKSDFRDNDTNYSASVIVCSDSISAGKKEDLAGKAIIKKLEESGVSIANYLVIPDEIEEIQQQVIALSKTTDLVIVTGGTGLSDRDVTPEALRPLIDREIPGIEEAIRSYGFERTPYAVLSRSVAGVRGKSLILGLPGSTRGAQESMDALFPSVLHLFKVLQNHSHD